jgi:hypothetical protein
MFSGVSRGVRKLTIQVTLDVSAHGQTFLHPLLRTRQGSV